MVAVVQTASHNSGAVTFGAGTTGGNCPVVGIGVESTAAVTITGVTLGGAAGHFGQLPGAQASANSGGIFQSVDMWADPNCASGQTAVAITASGSTVALGGVAWEVSGLAATLAGLLDKVSANHATSGAWSSGTTAATTKAAEFWAGVVSVNNTPTGPASPWTNTRPASDAVDMVAGQQVTTATGTATYSGTGSGIWAAAVVTLLPAAAATTAVAIAQLARGRPAASRPRSTIARPPAALRPPPALPVAARGRGPVSRSPGSVTARPAGRPAAPAARVAATRGRSPFARPASQVIRALTITGTPPPPVTFVPVIGGDKLKPWRKRLWPRITLEPPPAELSEAPPEAGGAPAAEPDDAPGQVPRSSRDLPGQLGAAAAALGAAATRRAARRVDPGHVVDDPQLAESILYWQQYRKRRKK